MESNEIEEQKAIESMTAIDLANVVQALEERFGESATAKAIPLAMPATPALARPIDKRKHARNALIAVLRKVLTHRKAEGAVQCEIEMWGSGADGAALRYLPVRIYLANGRRRKGVEAAVHQILDDLGLRVVAEYRGERGSWWKRLIARTKEPATQEFLIEQLQKAQRALELQVLQKNQAEIDRNQSEGAAALINALKGETRAVAQVGSIMVVKASDGAGCSQTFVRSLTQREMIAIEQHPEMLQKPNDILSFLENFTQPSTSTAEIIVSVASRDVSIPALSSREMPPPRQPAAPPNPYVPPTA